MSNIKTDNDTDRETGHDRSGHEGAATAPGFRSVGPGLSGRLLLLTIVFVMLAEVLIFVPSIANFRVAWLSDRLAAARTVALVWAAAPDGTISADLTRDLLVSVDAHAVALKTPDSRRLLAIAGKVPDVDVHVDTRSGPPWLTIIEAFETLTSTENRILRVVGPAPMDGGFIEIVLEERPLRTAMFVYSRNILLLSLAISGITATLVYLALMWLIVRPIRRLAGNMTAFRAHPEDASRVIVPSARTDEVGLAEHELAAMQRQLQSTLQSKSRLAALGLAVSKINHDLRNMMASAHLLSDRLSAIDSPEVQRFAPMLIRAIDRAIGFAEATLAYGGAQETPPERQRFALGPLAQEVREAVGLLPGSAIDWVAAIDRGLEVDADPDQLFRVLVNLVRNSLQALEQRAPNDPGRDQVRLAARREGTVVTIEVSDTGPGVPARARAHLFEAFQGSTRRGGAGLGLAISAELVHAHGGDIRLAEGTLGATFRITIPDRTTSLDAARAERAHA
ncbi:sensor histidine kinase [Blastochloris sulfoviridis]|uniref:histidine kinase n=1 Tax=Blastochloris sulfoviridis TaxID=50712 RepID=A0A5M6I427_9HYPH|nr:HAMP domain-containing sensor histidine kinase [Blastochloris sulfoviridis]KAA5602966.1 HAMP domain-containing histidine kinase [Blastochloris sulfoviridis]